MEVDGSKKMITGLSGVERRSNIGLEASTAVGQVSHRVKLELCKVPKDTGETIFQLNGMNKQQILSLERYSFVRFGICIPYNKTSFF